MTTAFRRTVERRNKRVWWPILPTEIRAKRAPFRLIAPLDEKRTAYLAKKLTFATPRPTYLLQIDDHGSDRYGRRARAPVLPAAAVPPVARAPQTYPRRGLIRTRAGRNARVGTQKINSIV